MPGRGCPPTAGPLTGPPDSLAIARQRLEAQADPELSTQFDMLDVNHDGYLSIAEFPAWRRAKRTQTPDPSTAPAAAAVHSTCRNTEHSETPGAH
jgi:hypothetical protein